MLTCDFFHVDCAVSLQRIYALFVIEINSRHIHILGATTNPDPGPRSRHATSSPTSVTAQPSFYS